MGKFRARDECREYFASSEHVDVVKKARVEASIVNTLRELLLTVSEFFQGLDEKKCIARLILGCIVLGIEFTRNEINLRIVRYIN